MRSVFPLFLALLLPSGSSAQAPLIKGQAALSAGRYAEALRLGKATVASLPNRYEGYRLVARASLGLDRPDDAEKAYRQALRLAPPNARTAIQNELVQVGALRVALGEIVKAKALKVSGESLAAARAQEAAYRVFPARPAYGLLAVDLYESSGRLDDARRVLEAVRERSLSTATAQRLAALQARIETARRTATEELDRRLADQTRADDERVATARRAEAAERKRVEAAKEAERRAEEERQRAEEERQREEKARQDREETDRLNGVLDGYRRDASSAESALHDAEGRAGDLDREARRLDHEADDARSRRDRAKGERDRAKSAVDDAKGDLARQVAQTALRGAENAYDDAKGDYDRADHRRDDAKSRLSAAQSDADAARRRLETARQGVRDTEAALARVGTD